MPGTEKARFLYKAFFKAQDLLGWFDEGAAIYADRAIVDLFGCATADAAYIPLVNVGVGGRSVQTRSAFIKGTPRESIRCLAWAQTASILNRI